MTWLLLPPECVIQEERSKRKSKYVLCLNLVRHKSSFLPHTVCHKRVTMLSPNSRKKIKVSVEGRAIKEFVDIFQNHHTLKSFIIPPESFCS